MAYTNIDDPSAYFQTTLYTGSGTPTNITNDGNSDLQPDMVWTKLRNSNNGANNISDSTRGVSTNTGKYVRTDATAAEADDANGIRAFNTNGFKTGDGWFNGASGSPYVAWQWKANGGTTASNTDGSITSTVQANTDAGFSIITYTGNATNSTVGHGLGVAPQVIFNKKRGATGSWSVWHKQACEGTQLLELNTTGSTVTVPAIWNSTVPTSSVFSIGTDGQTNSNNTTYVTYAFAEKQGYSKFGSYVGNGNGNGVFVYTGFKPAFVMVKDTGAAGNWFILDHKRNPHNLTDLWLVANGLGAETNYLSAFQLDMVSNGFKLRTSYSETNTSGRKYIYMAFAENPFTTSTGIPTTAR